MQQLKIILQKVYAPYGTPFVVIKNLFNDFCIYSKSRTRKIFATSKKFYDKILHRDFADYQNIGVTEMY